MWRIFLRLGFYTDPLVRRVDILSTLTNSTKFLYRPARKAGLHRLSLFLHQRCFYTDPLVRRVDLKLKDIDEMIRFYTDPLVRRVSEVVQTSSQVEGNGLVKSAIFGVECSITLSL